MPASGHCYQKKQNTLSWVVGCWKPECRRTMLVHFVLQGGLYTMSIARWKHHRLLDMPELFGQCACTLGLTPVSVAIVECWIYFTFLFGWTIGAHAINLKDGHKPLCWPEMGWRKSFNIVCGRNCIRGKKMLGKLFTCRWGRWEYQTTIRFIATLASWT